MGDTAAHSWARDMGLEKGARNLEEMLGGWWGVGWAWSQEGGSRVH